MSKLTYLSKLLCFTVIILLAGCFPAGQPGTSCEDALDYAFPETVGFSG